MSGDIVRGGDILTIQASPKSEYCVDTLTTVGMTENSNGTYTVTAENGDQTPFVSVSFKEVELEEPEPEVPEGSYQLTARTMCTSNPWAKIEDLLQFTFKVNGVETTYVPAGETVEIDYWLKDGFQFSAIIYTDPEDKFNTIRLDLTQDPITFVMPPVDLNLSFTFKAITYSGAIQTKVVDESGALREDPDVTVNALGTNNQQVTSFTYDVDREKWGLQTLVPPKGYEISKVTLKLADGTETDLSANYSNLTFGYAQDLTLIVEVKKLAEVEYTHVTDVYNAEDLKLLRDSVNAGLDYTGKTVTLHENIDLSEIDNWTPIGTGPGCAFHGTFHGQGKTISGLKIQQDTWFLTDLENGKTYLGLFGYAENAVIQNVTVQGTITLGSEFHHATAGNSCLVGGVLGGGVSTNITGCVNQVDITLTGRTCAGGVAGMLQDGLVSSCINYGKLNIETSSEAEIGSIGGIVGWWAGSNSTIENCGNSGNITCEGGQYWDGDQQAGPHGTLRDYTSGRFGGIVGCLYTGTKTIRSCFNKGSIRGDVNFCGGIVGEFQFGTSTLENCYNTGNIVTDGDGGRADARFCGMVGYLSTSGCTLTLKNCYNAGKFEPPSNNKYTGQSHEFYTTLLSANNTIVQEGCLTSAEIKTLEKQKLLVESVEEFVYDEKGINAALPHLAWELNYLSTDTFPITFTIAPASVKATVKIYSDAALQTQIQPEKDGGYRLPMGTYYYAVSAEGYRTETGSFPVTIGAVEVPVTLRPAVQVTFQVTPAQAKFVLTTAAGTEIAPDSTPTTSGNICSYVYTLYTNTAYNYEASCAGYASDGNNYVVTNQNATVRVTLNTSTYPGTGGSSGEETAKMIYGDSNEGTTNTIKEGGTYYLGNGNLQRGEGVITINTTQPVTLVGPGTRPSDQYSDLHIRCVQEGSKLTLQDVYISNKLGRSDPKMTNMIDFTGTGNTLTFAGTCILDQDTEATGYAMIHAGEGTELTISGGTAYMYKNEQGAGIGGNGGADPNKLNGSGQSIEYNGTITIQNAKLFLKGTKQGAGIGGGAGVGSSGNPGTITIQNSTLNLITNARGAAIGAGAGKKDSLGPEVHISNSSVNINVNYSGAAIGGGGYGGEQDDTGDNMGANDSPGGTLYYGGNSSIRAYVDANAANAFGTDGAGVHNNITITADVVDESTRKPLYLLALDTQGIPAGSASAPYVVLEDGKTVYSGDLHRYGYVNEDATKYGGSSVAVSSTIANWTAGDDTCLYLYMPEGSHELTVNGVTFNAVWDAGSKSFTVTKKDESSEGPEGTGGPSGEPGQPETPDEPATEVGGQTTVEDGVATTVVDREELLDALEKADGGPIIITADIPEDETVTETTTVLTRGDVGEIAETGASLTISSPLADIVLSTDSLWHISGEEGQEEETVTITAAVTKDGTAIEVTANGVVMEKVNGGLQVTLPVDGEELSAGSVMIVVDEKGKETVIKKSAQNKDGDGFTGLLKGSCTVKVVENAKRFQDVVSDDWFAEAVDFTSSRELFTGVTEVTFDPNGSITRAMLVTVLHRLEDTPDTALQDVFDDVPAGTWYSDAVHWASENRIVNGYSEGTFGGDDFAERQQMAAILYRYANVLGLDVSIRGDLSRFTDAELVDDYAVEAMEWAVGTGLFIGDEFGVLNPGGSASRAEAAIVLQRFIQLIMR